MGNITNFYLCAHSYGAYLMGTYATQYPQHIRKLVLLSPLGVKKSPDNFNLSKIRFMRGSGPPWWAQTLANNLWGKVNPFTLLRMQSESRVRTSLGKYVNAHQPVADEVESECLQEYLFQILLRESSTEAALFCQFDNGLHAHLPLSSPEKLCSNEIPFPVSFIYGSFDWMDARGSR